MKIKRRIGAVIFCLIACSIFFAVPVSAASDVNTSINDMNDFAFKVYKAIRAVVVPLAIVSFASCAFKFLGSIFFGNYASMAGNDMMKAQKQLVFTIMAVLFIVLLPTIFSIAISIFKRSAWDPSSQPKIPGIEDYIRDYLGQ